MVYWRMLRLRGNPLGLPRGVVSLLMSLPRTQSFSEIKYSPVISGIPSQNVHHERYKARQKAKLAGAGGENI